MGFRDFTCFNQALVAKQWWRLLQFPSSLVSKVLQARYYRSFSFLSASVGSNPSFIWRSILWGREVIKRGFRWRVGDGRKISVYKDNWLPMPDTFKPFSPLILLEDSVVVDLINEEKLWNEGKLNHHFMQDDIAVILKIPLPKDLADDEPMWHFDKRGEYSVKSGYQLALKIKFPEASNS
ncbi:putative reverse transcriptase/RNA-dependent DNA polymerase [Citrus sinensis]|uniref:Reverse transcriptase/RNA-dependent DNA polymerase n=1 Tax=Citrus sinensis TaxID=2711 RepID=A0ACB8NHS7_CITSI|nr:putative reverse transcriptase/RNA-dependent DNA polymerase [Citrus sinensis]